MTVTYVVVTLAAVLVALVVVLVLHYFRLPYPSKDQNPYTLRYPYKVHAESNNPIMLYDSLYGILLHALDEY